MKKQKRKDKTNAVASARWLAFGMLFAITLAAYWNSFGVPFVFDDLLTIERNTGVRFGEFAWNFLLQRSVLYLTFTLNYVWTAREVWSYHLVNFLIHFLNGVLVFLAAEHIFRRSERSPESSRWYAGLAAAFFLVHPLQTESVTYISSRSELLSTFFYLIGFLVFLFWRTDRIGFVCSLAVAVPMYLGLGSKETAITLPASILLYDFLFNSGAQVRPLFSRWRFYLPFIVGGSAAIYYLLTGPLRGVVGGELYQHLSVPHYFLTQLRVIVKYVQLVFVPVGLNLDHDVQPSSSLLEPAVIGALLFLCGLLFLAWCLRLRKPVLSFSIFWFFITLSPTSSVIPIRDVIFEHRLYLPLAGVCLSFPLLVQMVFDFLSRRFTVPGRASVYACLILAALAGGTISRNWIWGDEVRLWEDAVSKSPEKERSYSGLVFALYKRGEYDRAIQVLERARVNAPDERRGFSETLGRIYLMTGRYQEALELAKENVDQLSGTLKAMAYNNLGTVYLTEWDSLRSKRNGLTDEQFEHETQRILKLAGEAYANALKIDKTMFSAVDSYVNVSFYLGTVDEVKAAAEEQLKDKDDFNSLYTLGKIEFLNKDYAKADAYFERAEKLATDVKLVFFNHGYVLSQLGENDRAIEKYIQSIRIDPLFIEAHHNLALILMGREDYAAAIEHFNEVLRFDAKHSSANLNLAKIYMAQGNKPLVRRHLATVLEVSPGDQQAAGMLQQLGP